MSKFSIADKTRFGLEAFLRLIQKKPLFVGLEVTYECEAGCDFCDIPSGKWKDVEPLDSYREILLPLNPLAITLTGGEPLLREDLEQIAEEAKNLPTPLVFLNTNGLHLTKNRYHSLQDSGVDMFLVSLDFPDKRHDELRKIEGLYTHLERIIPELATEGCEDIILNPIIMAQNLGDIVALVDLAKEWGVKIRFNLYAITRTGNPNFLVGQDKIPELRKVVNHLRQQEIVFNSDEYIDGIIDFVMNKEPFGCQAGKRFFWITPNGQYKPCCNHGVTGDFDILERFYKNNQCNSCYLACRVNSQSTSLRSPLHYLKLS